MDAHLIKNVMVHELSHVSMSLYMCMAVEYTRNSVRILCVNIGRAGLSGCLMCHVPCTYTHVVAVETFRKRSPKLF